MAFGNCWRIIVIDCRHIFQTESCIALSHHVYVRSRPNLRTQLSITLAMPSPVISPRWDGLESYKIFYNCTRSRAVY